MAYRFEWDSHKASANIRKHGVSFDEASTVFDDPSALIFPDEDHSDAEERELIIGYSLSHRLLVVGYTERAGEVLRLISARSATRKERNQYEENRF